MKGIDMKFGVLKKINLSPGKVLEESLIFVSERGYQPHIGQSIVRSNVILE